VDNRQKGKDFIGEAQETPSRKVYWEDEILTPRERIVLEKTSETEDMSQAYWQLEFIKRALKAATSVSTDNEDENTEASQNNHFIK
jgi:hypothetical protein